MIKVPCRDCEERKINCHSECKRYMDFKKESEETNKNKRKAMVNYSANFWSKHFN